MDGSGQYTLGRLEGKLDMVLKQLEANAIQSQTAIEAHRSAVDIALAEVKLNHATSMKDIEVKLAGNSARLTAVEHWKTRVSAYLLGGGAVFGVFWTVFKLVLPYFTR